MCRCGKQSETEPLVGVWSRVRKSRGVARAPSLIQIKLPTVLPSRHHHHLHRHSVAHQQQQQQSFLVEHVNRTPCHGRHSCASIRLCYPSHIGQHLSHRRSSSFLAYQTLEIFKITWIQYSLHRTDWKAVYQLHSNQDHVEPTDVLLSGFKDPTRLHRMPSHICAARSYVRPGAGAYRGAADRGGRTFDI